MDKDALTGLVIGCAIEVHKHLGPGLLESAYKKCLARELTINSIDFQEEYQIPVIYKGIHLECGYRLDIFVANKLVLELKAVAAIAEIHKAQLLSYMKLVGAKTGLLINFNVAVLKNGLHRMVL